MAILGKIRKQTGLLIGATAFGLLAFLVPWNSVSDFFTGRKNPNVFGKVNGDAITREEYYGQLNLLNTQFQGQYPKEILEGETWNSIVRNMLVEQKFNQAGFTLTDKMIWDMAKYSPFLANDPQFKDKNGKFNAQLVQEYFQKIESEFNGSAQAQEAFQTMMALKRNFSYQAMYKQYLGAYGAGMLSNSKEAEILAKNQSDLANIEFVKIDYNAFQKQNPVTVTDEDLQAYINKHKTLFKIDENRTLDYVLFSAKPTKNDEEVTLHSLSKLLSSSIVEGDTIKAFGAVRNDSVYINDLNSAQLVDKNFVSQYRYANQLPAAIQNWSKNASIGQISEPYQDGQYYIISKLIGKKNSDSIKAQSILISFTGANAQITPKKTRTKEQAKKQAEELVTQLSANPNEFMKLGTELSDDPGFATNKGEIELTTAQGFPFKPLQDFFENAAKDKIGMVETPAGFMVIHVIERKSDALVYKLADLAKEIKASDITTEKARKESRDFVQAVQGKSSKDFQQIAYKSKYKPLQQNEILRFGSMLQGLNSDKDSEIIAWAFNSERKLGDTKLFTTNDESQIVVRVSSLFNKGLAQPSQIRKNYETIVRNEKLAKIIAEKVNNDNKPLDQLAKEFKTEKSSAAISFMNPVVSGALEPKVGGAAFGLKPGTISKAIEGLSGVYVIVTKSITKGEAGDKKQLKNQLMDTYSQQLPSLFLKTLNDDANITDYRADIIDKQELH